ncbi:MAG TPA: hypothetical protein EYP85_01050 [Armatimonadetes bacterium]|nr:hypothetical protein [Armatimonadota bacterium]
MNRPKHEFRAGLVQATIWENRAEREGEVVTYYRVEIKRSYQDQEGNWQDTHYFRPSDLPRVALVANKAYEYLTLRERRPEQEMPTEVPPPPAYPEEEEEVFAEEALTEEVAAEEMITEQQERAIRHLVQMAGLSEQELRERLVQDYGKTSVEGLTYQEATALIRALQA